MTIIERVGIPTSPHAATTCLKLDIAVNTSFVEALRKQSANSLAVYSGDMVDVVAPRRILAKTATGYHIVFVQQQRHCLAL